MYMVLLVRCMIYFSMICVGCCLGNFGVIFCCWWELFFGVCVFKGDYVGVLCVNLVEY